MTFSFFMAQGRSGVVVRFVPKADAYALTKLLCNIRYTIAKILSLGIWKSTKKNCQVYLTTSSLARNTLQLEYLVYPVRMRSVSLCQD